MAAPSKRLPFRILPATEKDCPDLAKIEVISFNNVISEPPENAILKIMLGPPTEELISYRTKSFVDRLKTHPATRFWKAVIDDENEPNGEKIVACALWKFFTKSEKIADWKPITEWPLSISPDACNEIVEEITAMRRTYMDEKCYGCKDISPFISELQLILSQFSKSSAHCLSIVGVELPLH